MCHMYYITYKELHYIYIFESVSKVVIEVSATS